MSMLACMDARGLLTRRRAGLAEPDRLRLEHHLEGCAQCRFDAAVLDGVARAVTETEVEGRADRALERALRAEPVVAAEPRSRSSAIWVIAAAAVILLAAGVLALGGDEPREDRGHLVAARPTRVNVAHAVVRAARDTEIEWRGSTLELVRGEVSVDVDPSRHAPFCVRTEHFDVEVTGTSFEVTTDRVRVRRGSVRIVSRTGTVLDPHVGAGEVWTRELPMRRAERSPEARIAEAPRVPEPDAVEARPRARRAEPPEPQAPRARWEAAVRTEAAAPDAALAEYRAIEREGGPYAATALFARGRLLHQLQRRAEARAVLERYLALHPEGPNADDARQLLSAP